MNFQQLDLMNQRISTLEAAQVLQVGINADQVTVNAQVEALTAQVAALTAQVAAQVANLTANQ